MEESFDWKKDVRMRTGGYQMHMNRVSAASKERRCRVKCTLHVTAWTLFLILLPTSSIGQSDDQDQGAGHSATSTQKLVSGPLDGEPSARDRCSTPLLAECAENYDESLNSKSVNYRDNEWPGRPSALVTPSIRIQESREPIDALQYAEYGAGLLQKNGPAEESLKICRIRDSSGSRCLIINHHGDLTRQKCLKHTTSSGHPERLCLDEFLPDDRCHDAVSYGVDVVAELEPGELHLVCQRDTLAGTVVCEVACSSRSNCFFLEIDSKVCQQRGSLRDYIQKVCEGDSGLEALETSSRAQGLQIPNDADTEILQGSTQRTKQSAEDGSPFIVEVGEESLLVPDGQEQDGDALGNILEEALVEEVSDGDSAEEDPPQSTEDDDAFPTLTDADSKMVELVQTGLQGEVGRQIDKVEVNSHLTSQLGTEQEPSRLKRVGSVLNLEEYRKTILEKQQEIGNHVDLTSVAPQKLRQSDRTYNYAAASYGGKVVASNKEAKGINHILVSDKDKYLLNPCGAEDKYVVLELSEEAFVDTLIISNFEFHSSNLKDFEILGSPVFPTKEWIFLGKFRAENIRDRQRFNLEDPKLVRYLLLKMLSHWGSEFFCTLSVVEVFGVNVIQNLLDDWIALDELESSVRTQESNGSIPPQDELSRVGIVQQTEGHENSSDFENSSENEPVSESGTGADPGLTGGKPLGDSLLKILMQRVKALELNQTLFDLYLGDINLKYKAMLYELDKDLALVSEQLRNETALTASLAMQLAARELQRKDEKFYMEHQFALIANNFTDTLDFMRWHVLSLERREISAVVLALFCMILSAFLHLVGCCVQRHVSKNDLSLEPVSKGVYGQLDICSLQSVCRASSTFVLYLASGLTILVLSV